MRKELIGFADVCLVLGFRKRLQQVTHIELNGQLLSVPDIQQACCRSGRRNLWRQVRMHSERTTAAAAGVRQWNQARLRDRQASSVANVEVIVVLRIERNDRVVAVIAAKQKDADERLVVGSDLGLILNASLHNVELV